MTLTFSAAMAMAALAWGGGPAVQPPTKKAPAQKPAVVASKPTTAVVSAKKPVTGKKPVVASTAQHGKKAPARPSTTWRNRQTTPSADRYKEIQEALVTKGYLSPEEVTGTWGQASADALKNFQAEQTLESTGKINSLSLIALGLGPKHDSINNRPVDGNFAQPEMGRN